MTIKKILFRRGTAAEWTTTNTVLAAGEPGYETDTGKEKRGDGVTAWSALPYAGGTGTAIEVVNDLTTGGATKALSAAQGVVLKASVDAKVEDNLTASTTVAPSKTAVSTALAAKAADSALTAHTGSVTNPHSVTKTQVGLGNVDNTADASKPVSTAQQAAIDAKVQTGVLVGAATVAPNAQAVVDALAVKLTDLGTVALIAATTLYKPDHGNRPLSFSGANANLTLASDAASDAAGKARWVFGDAIDVSTLASSAGVPTIVTPDGKSIAGSATKEIGATCKASDSWTVGTTDPATAGTASFLDAVTSLGSGLTLNAGVLAATAGGTPVPITVSGLTAVGSVLTANIAAGWVNTGGNWTRNGANIAGATALTYTAVIADAGSSVTYASTNIPYIPQGITVVAGVPGAPTALTLGTATDTTQPLTWTAPASDGGSAITDYLVEYKLTSSGTWLVFADGTSTGVSATVTGLVAGSAYDYRVSAINAIGTGTASDVVSGSTSSGATLSITWLPSINDVVLSDTTETAAVSEFVNKFGTNNDGVYNVASDPEVFGAIGSVFTRTNCVKGSANFGWSPAGNTAGQDLCTGNDAVDLNADLVVSMTAPALSAGMRRIRLWVAPANYQDSGLGANHLPQIFASLGDGSAAPVSVNIDMTTQTNSYAQRMFCFDIAFRGNADTTLTFGYKDPAAGQSPILWGVGIARVAYYAS